MINQDQHRVLLPSRIFEEAKDKDELKRLALQYMKRYPHYFIKEIKDGFAICERR